MSAEPLDTTLIDSCIEFLGRYYRHDIGQLAQGYPRDQSSLVVSFGDLRQYDPALADDYLAQPDTVRDHLEEALANVDLPIDVDLSGAAIRMADLPDTRTFHVDELRQHTVGDAVAVTGQVSNRTAVRIAPRAAVFECQRCGTECKVPQEEFVTDIQEPHECSGCERQGPFVLDNDRSTLRNIQIARVQLPPERSAGDTSASVDVFLSGGAVGQVDAGDRVTVAGRHTLDDDQGVGFAHQLVGESVGIEETTFSAVDVDEHLDEVEKLADGQYGDPYELLRASIAPSIVEQETIKRVLSLQLFGGVRAQSPDGTTTRGDIHVLLIGDPGTAKSTFLEDIERKAPNAVSASGKGATAAGLTASATQTDFGGGSEWTLDAGALVLADDGIACIDELDKVGEDAVQSLHQALSKQRVNINKAGINTTLPTRTTLLAAGNPKHGRFDDFESIAEQIDLPPTLLSRFDVIWTLNDDPVPETDETIASGMMANHDESIRYTRGDIGGDETSISPAVSADLLRAWIAHAKQSCMPRWPEGAARQDLVESFVALRRAGVGEDQPVPITFRAIESQRRLAEASARIRLSDTVEPEDVSRARELYLEAMQAVGIDPETDQMDADVIETGQSTSQRKRVRSLLDIVAELQQEYDSGAPIDLVVERADKLEINEGQARHEIGKLKEKGELYQPEQGYVRTT